MLVSTWRAQWRGLQSAVALNGACPGAGLVYGPSSTRIVAHICHANTADAVFVEGSVCVGFVILSYVYKSNIGVSSSQI